MLLVIFGAGASYDSVDPAVTNPVLLRPGTPDLSIENYRPPLAKDLVADWGNYARIIDEYPACRPVIQRLRQAALGPDFNIERELESVQAEADHYPRRFKQLAAVRYYLQQLLWECGVKTGELSHGMTNYLRFLDRLDHWRSQRKERVLIATFNYDTLVERALKDALDIEFPSVDEFTVREDYRLYKLHGSVNWGKRVLFSPDRALFDTWTTDERNYSRSLQDNAESLESIGTYEIMQHPMDIQITDESVLFPAIAVPFERKYDFECPQEQLSELFTLVEDATEVLIVGWRATEQHFLERLTEDFRRGYRRLTVVAGSREYADHTISNLVRVGINRNLESTSFGFSEFSRTGMDQWLQGISG